MAEDRVGWRVAAKVVAKVGWRGLMKVTLTVCETVFLRGGKWVVLKVARKVPG